MILFCLISFENEMVKRDWELEIQTLLIGFAFLGKVNDLHRCDHFSKLQQTVKIAFHNLEMYDLLITKPSLNFAGDIW